MKETLYTCDAKGCTRTLKMKEPYVREFIVGWHRITFRCNEETPDRVVFLCREHARAFAEMMGADVPVEGD